MDLAVLNLNLEVMELFSLSSGHPNLEINIFHVSDRIFLSISILFLYFLFKSARDKLNMNATGTSFDLEDVMQFMDFKEFESALMS